VTKVSVVLGYDSVSLGDWFPIFEDNVVEGRNVQIENPYLTCFQRPIHPHLN
jgi:hypothetical protein